MKIGHHCCDRRWQDAKLLPGALRLLRHLRACGCRVGVATSTPRSTFLNKTANKPWLVELLDAVVCGDEVCVGCD